MQQICPDLPVETPGDTRIAQSIAREIDQPLPLVQRAYAEALAELARNARITQFLGVLAARRVRQRLRRH